MTDLMMTNALPTAVATSRERLYNEEYARLASFRGASDLEGCHPVLLARAGLYYTGPDDTLRCFSCNAAVADWHACAANPVTLHRQANPHCPHSQGEDETNHPVPNLDPAATTIAKDYLRQRCRELTQNPTPVYLDLCRTFSGIDGLSRGEMLGAAAGLETAEPATLGFDQDLVEMNASEAPADTTRPLTGSIIDFELCKNSVHERLKTFERWPMAAEVHPLNLAEAGFIFTGPQDRVQCVHCEGSLRNWQNGDIPSEEHARHFPTCPMILSSQENAAALPLGPTITFPDQPPLPSIPTPAEVAGLDGPVVRRELLGIVTERPKHPTMAVEATRMGTYGGWPTGKTQTPQQLAKAGFFYAGFNDSVKCFFCDGGLRNWEREDDPWHEHARWFPRCKYVRQVKGDSFVEQVQAEEDGHVQQTASYHGQDVGERGRSSPTASGTERSRSRSRSGSAGRREGERRPPPVVEGREILARMDTPMVQAVLNLGIPPELVRRAVEHKLRTTGDDFMNVEALLDMVFDLSTSHQGSGEPVPLNTVAGEADTAGMHHHSAENEHGGKGTPTRRPASGEQAPVFEAPRALIEENRQLKEQRTCKICMDEEVCVVFVPCGHLVCCALCAPPLSRCPICRSTIRGTVRTYMS